MTYTPEYEIWCGVKKRCFNSKCKAYKDYGGRGVTMCPEWSDSFQAFYDHVGPRPSPDHEIDRFPDNNGNYEPGNVRWATVKQQCNNRRSNRLVTVNGITKTLMQWGEETGFGWAVIKSRLDRGFSDYDAVTTPLSSRGRKAGDCPPGVSCRGPGKYRAMIRVGGKLIHLGQFQTAEMAHEAYLKAKEAVNGQEEVQREPAFQPS